MATRDRELIPFVDKRYRTVGEREGNAERDMVVDLRRFSLELRAFREFRIEADVLEDETHNSVFPRALSNGLRFVFEVR